MERCYVCASSLTSGSQACSSCHTEVRLLREFEEACSRKGFLFGQTRSAPSKPVTPVPPPPPVRNRPGVRRKKAVEPNHMDAPLFRDFQEEERQVFLENSVLDRDVLPPKPPKSTFYFRMVSYLIDVVLCLLLNLFVLRLILSFSDRNISNLVTFSLIPLLFVFLSFTVLYFWLFTGLIHKSLGNIIAEKLRDDRADVRS